MNGKEEYITTEITQSKGGQPNRGGRPRERKEAPGCERSWGFPSSSEGSLLPGTLGRLSLCVFCPQNKPSPYQSQLLDPLFTNSLYWALQLASSTGKLFVQ